MSTVLFLNIFVYDIMVTILNSKKVTSSRKSKDSYYYYYLYCITQCYALYMIYIEFKFV